MISGRVWLTQPHVAQDLFLGPGSGVALWPDCIVVGADAEPGQRVTDTEVGAEESVRMAEPAHDDVVRRPGTDAPHGDEF